MSRSTPHTSPIEDSHDFSKDIAICGMACIVPGASDLDQFWGNILSKVDSIREVPSDRFDTSLWFDPDQSARDKMYSKWGGFIDDVIFDPLKFGIPPRAVESIDPIQLLTLELVDRALTDAGYSGDENPYRLRTSVIFGAGGGLGQLGTAYGFRALLPQFIEQPDPSIWEGLPEWTEDSFAGLLLNVISGRISNRFDFGGVNYTVDAACASSLAALYHATRELRSHTSDMVIAGGCDTMQDAFSFMAFSKTSALSPTGQCRPFDASADGIAISEGMAAIVLKRLEDAERDGDRIYAVIRGVAGGSDGRAMSLTAPSGEGQVRTLKRAYQDAQVDPETVGLFEAHGTGTQLGDKTEVQALLTLLRDADVSSQRVALGSVKSMIGHTKSAAGMIGLVKTALALSYRVLPPTLHVQTPNQKAGLSSGPLYVNSELRPWLAGQHLRRAGVSAFGFGGTNFHAVLEEYDLHTASPRVPLRSAELVTWAASTRDELKAQLNETLRELEGVQPEQTTADFAVRAAAWHAGQPGPSSERSWRAAAVAADGTELREQLTALLGGLDDEMRTSGEPTADAVWGDGSSRGEPVAFLFPGQGAQFLNMTRDLALEFPQILNCFEQADGELFQSLGGPLSQYVFPPSAYTSKERDRQFELLKKTDITQPALGVCSVAVHRLLGLFNVQPDMTGGHSYGELVALHAAGCLDERTLFYLSRERGLAMTAMSAGDGQQDLGTMLAVSADEAATLGALGPIESLSLANLNSPSQTVLSGSVRAIERARKRLAEAGLSTAQIPVGCAFHSPIMKPARKRFLEVLNNCRLTIPRLPVYSNFTAERYPEDVDAIPSNLGNQLVSKVQFVRQIESMYAGGARIFIEVGPNSLLTRFVGQILSDSPHVAIATQPKDGNGTRHFLTALARLFTLGKDLRLDVLYEGRERVRPADLDSGRTVNRDHLWLINGAYSRRYGTPKRPSPRPVRHTSIPAHRPHPESGHLQQPGGQALPAMAPTDATGQTATQFHVEFQKTMQEFLSLQERFLSSLGSGAAPPAVNPIPVTADVPVPAQQVSEPPVQENAAAFDAPGTQTGKDAPPPLADAGVSIEKLLLAAVEERTGYPPEMLDFDVDTEADLGIDSIKRMEIVATVRQQLIPGQDEPPEWFIDLISGARTLGSIRDGLSQLVEELSPTAAPISAGASSTPGSAGALNGAHCDAATVDRVLLAAVEERTGYPPEMLDFDVDTEADLGIDSIKRMEIVATVRQQLIPGQDEPPEWFIDLISSARTLASIRDGLLQLLASVDPLPELSDKGGNGAGSSSNGGSSQSVDLVPTACCIARTVERPVEHEATLDLASGVVVISDDGHIAQKLQEALAAQDITAVLIDAAALRSRATTEEAFEAARSEHGRIAGIIHALPLREAPEYPGIERKAWHERMDEEIAGLLFMLQAHADAFDRSDPSAPAFALALSTGGGDFDPDDATECRHPWRGGLAGLMKTAALEWPTAHLRVVDFHGQPAADVVLQELRIGGPVEIGYRTGRRLAIEAVHAHRSEGPPESLPLRADSVVLVTGGARGITAEVVRELAGHAPATFILLGRSSHPDSIEDDRFAEIHDPMALKRALIQEGQEAGSVSAHVIETKWRRILADREIRTNLARMRETGATIVYKVCDVRDADSLHSVVDGVQRQHGPITGIIHGAGVLQDQLLTEKSAESFIEVIGTKCDPLLSLPGLVSPDTLEFLMLFSSIAGFTGNAGQGDYAAANEILNRAGRRLASHLGIRVISFNWGPWEGGGMVTEEVARQFAERSITLIPTKDGCRIALESLIQAPLPGVRIIVGNGPWVVSGNEQPPSPGPGLQAASGTEEKLMESGLT